MSCSNPQYLVLKLWASTSLNPISQSVYLAYQKHYILNIDEWMNSLFTDISALSTLLQIQFKLLQETACLRMKPSEWRGQRALCSLALASVLHCSSHPQGDEIHSDLTTALSKYAIFFHNSLFLQCSSLCLDHPHFICQMNFYSVLKAQLKWHLSL